MKEKLIIVEKPEKDSGVYVIVNPVTMKAYIGETDNFYRRWAEHVGSIFGLESSSNRNLMAEEIKTFELFPAILADYQKDVTNASIKDWRVHETVMMYVFRKNGFALYNGGKGGKDDTGKERAFIFDETVTGEVLKQKVVTYLEQQDPRKNALADFEVESWEDLFQAAEDEMNKSFQSRFHMSLTEFAKLKNNPSERMKLWCQRSGVSLKKERFYCITEDNAYMICKELYVIAFSKKVLASDLKRYGLKEISAEQFADMARGGALDRIIVSKYGAYYDQSAETILSTKVYDIQHNKLRDLQGIDIAGNEDVGICFWALKRLDIAATKAFLSFDETHKEPRYVLLRYTPSEKSAYSVAKDENLKLEYMQALNPWEDENLDDFFKRIRGTLDEKPISNIAQVKYAQEKYAQEKYALGYAATEKQIENTSGLKYTYPENMFPEVIDKGREISKALLISELSYINADYKEMDELYEHFHSHLGYVGKTYTNELWETIGSKKRGKITSMSHCRAQIKEDSRIALAEYLGNRDSYEVNGKVSYLLAKLEYPYIIALAQDLVE